MHASEMNAETKMSSNGAGKSVVSSFREDCPAVRSSVNDIDL